MQPGHTAA
jgi:hypothetical protein